MATDDDTFELYDLRVSVVEIRGNCTCTHQVGDWFELRSGKLHIPTVNGFCVYALQSTLPLLPAKQRPTHPSDWMTTDTHVTCPDPECGLIMRIDRIARRKLHHADVSAIPLRGGP